MKLYVLALFLIVALSGFLRFFQLATNPPGMYVDEASIGVNAYQILTTGKDEHGETMPLFFKAFGEYKLPVYIYLTSVSMLLFGKTEFAVRFTSALFGTATVLLIYYFLRTLMVFDKKSFTQMHRQALPFIGAVILAVTPWHIQFSRGGFEANVALFFFLLGIFCLLQYLLSKKELFLSCFFISLLITLYTYSTYRLLTPLLLIFVIGYLYSKKKLTRSFILNLLVFGVISIPFLIFSFSSNGIIRVSQTSAFTEYKVDTLWEKIITYPLVYIRNYIGFFSPSFLFTNGDGIGRHQVPGFGLLLRAELPLLVLGLIFLIKRKSSLLLFVVVALLCIAPLPAAIARPSPHTLRSFLLVVPFIICVAAGFYVLWNKAKLLFIIVTLLLCFEFLLYSHSYFMHYPKTNIPDWGEGYKQMVLDSRNYQKTNTIYVENSLTYAPIYFAFYAPEVRYTMVSNTFATAGKYQKGSSIWIKRFYDVEESEQIVHTTYISSVNRDRFSQFWKL